MTGNFSRKVTDVGDVHLVALRGELDLATAEGLTDWLVEIGGSPTVVDLSGLTFLDSRGISALAMAKRQMAEAGNELILARPTPMVRRTLEIVGLADWIGDWESVWENGSTGS